MQRDDVPAEVQKAFKQVEWVVDTFGVGPINSFKDFSDLYEFVDKQVQQWASVRETSFHIIYRYWIDIKILFDAVIRDATDEAIENTFATAKSSLKAKKWPNLLAESAVGTTILSEGLAWGRQYQSGFAAAFNDHSPSSFGNAEFIKGYIRGTIFAEADKMSVQFADVSRQWETTIASFQSMAANLESQLDTNARAAEEALIDSSHNFDELQDKVFEWFDSTKQSFEEAERERTKRLDDIEGLYEEKLKLEAPAKYWADRAKGLFRAGIGWALASAGTVAIGAWVLWEFFLSFDQSVELMKVAAEAAGAADKDVKSVLITYFSSAQNLKSMIAFTVIVSAILFLLRTFIKLSLSAFHLSLDAKEREQLSYMYLSLIQTGQNLKTDLIKEKDREIILQALFSRADTGLLKGDSSPTMPGDLSNLLKHLGGKS